VVRLRGRVLRPAVALLGGADLTFIFINLRFGLKSFRTLFQPKNYYITSGTTLIDLVTSEFVQKYPVGEVTLHCNAYLLWLRRRLPPTSEVEKLQFAIVLVL
jgi:hypothetical protein